MTVLPLSRPRSLRRHGRADGHPGQHGVVARLGDGGTAALRPLRTGETDVLLAVFAGMSDKSRANRYLAGATRLPAAMLAALADVDGYDHAAWLATVADRPAGIARYVRLGPGLAEVAFEVVDACHGRGLGSVLVDAITTVAAANGFSRIQATVTPGNAPSQRLLRRLGIQLAMDGGLLEGEGPLRLLDPPRVDRAAVLTLAAHARAGGPETLYASPR